MNRELRPRQAGVAAAWIGPDRLAVTVGVAQFARLDARGGERRFEPEPREDANRARLDVDADAEWPRLARLLAQFDLEARAMQAQGGGEASDAGAGDDDFHRLRIAAQPAFGQGGQVGRPALLGVVAELAQIGPAVDAG